MGILFERVLDSYKPHSKRVLATVGNMSLVHPDTFGWEDMVVDMAVGMAWVSKLALHMAFELVVGLVSCFGQI